MKYRPVLLTLILIFLLIVYIAEATSYKNNLFYYIAKQKNKIPSRYIAPTETQIRLFKEAIWHILHKEFAGATRALNAVGYTLKSITHINGLTYYIVESTDPKYRPWGTYVFYVEDDRLDYVIEVPHPYEEKNTTRIGIKAFVGVDINTKAKAFLMSGSRKGPGDVTLNEDSIFQAVHEETTKDPSTVALQIHGFNRKAYPQIVLTSGTPIAVPAMDELVDELIENGFEVGIYNGVQYRDCGATQNVQGKYSNNIGSSFIGVYLNRAVHNSAQKSALVIDAIEEYITGETTTTETPSYRYG